MPPADNELRRKAEEHQRFLDRNTLYFKVADLAKRWSCSASAVRAIPSSQLPYINVGTGLVREARRYHPDDVLNYEQQYRRPNEQRRRAS